MLKVLIKKLVIVFFVELILEEIDVLQYVEKFMKLCKLEFCMVIIDILEFLGIVSVVNLKDFGYYDILCILLSGKIDYYCEIY